MITPDILLKWLLQTSVAFISSVAFSVIFHTPRRQMIFAGFTGALGWLVYVASVDLGTDVSFASFFAAVALAWIARIFSFARKEPVTIFIICGIFPIVPGAGIYYTGYHFFMSDNSLALNKGLETFKTAIAIAIGIGIVLALPRFFFTWSKSNRKGKDISS